MRFRRLLHLAVIFSMVLTLVSVAFPAVASAAGQPLITPASYTFPDQQVATLSPQKSFVLINLAQLPGNTVTVVNTPIITGANASDFKLVQQSCSLQQVLDSGDTCTVDVSFQPSGPSVRNAVLRFVLDSGNGPENYDVPVSGTGVAGNIDITPSSVNFGNVTAGFSTAYAEVLVQNHGETNLAVTNAQITGTDAALFNNGFQNGCSAVTVTAGDQCDLSVHFVSSPNTPLGPKSANLVVTYNDGSGQMAQVIPLTATVVQAAQVLTVNPTAFTFPDTVAGQKSPAQSFVLSNAGPNPVTVTSATIGLGDTTRFEILGNGCTNTPLNPGQSCTVIARFVTDPADSGHYASSLIFAVPGQPTVVVPLDGNVVAQSPGNAPFATLNPPTLDFTDAVGGGHSAQQTATLTNTGAATLTINGIDPVSGPNMNDFGVNHNCPPTLTPGQSCAITATFNATVVGFESAQVNIRTNGGNRVLALNGTGTAAPPPPTGVGTVSPPFIYFDPPIGVWSAAVPVTLTNTGNAPLTISAVGLGMGDSGDFNIITDGCTSLTPLAPGASCQVYVRFKASRLGYEATSLVFATNGSPQFIIVPMEGFGDPDNAIVSASPTLLQFGNVPLGSVSGPQTVTLTNIGNVDVGIGAITSSNADFHIINNTCTTNTLQAPTGPPNNGPAGTCTFDVYVQPTATGTLVSDIAITLGGGNTPLHVAAVANGVNIGLTATPNPVVFPDTPIGQQAPDQIVTITNNGAVSATIAAPTATPNPPFSVVSNGCTTLAPGTNCQMIVRFAPTVGPTGLQNGLLSFTATIAGTNYTYGVSLHGTALVAASAYSVAPSSYDFGPVPAGTNSAPQTFTLTNTGATPLTVTGAGKAGGDTGKFDILSDGCGPAVTLNPGQTCTVVVRYEPAGTDTGLQTTTLTIAVTGQPTAQIPLRGTAVAQNAANGPFATLIPSSLSFTDSVDGNPTAQQTATLTNTGAAPLTITAFTKTGLNLADFDVNNNCGALPATLAPGQSCTITATFNATIVGNESAQYLIETNGGNRTLVLNGTGTTAPSPSGQWEPSSYIFGNTPIGAPSNTAILTLRNTGTTPLVLANQAAIAGGDAGDFVLINTSCTAGATLQPNQTCTFEFRFVPTAAGNRASSVQVLANVVGWIIAPISGVGVSYSGTVSPLSLNFGNLQVSTQSQPQTVTLTNTSSVAITLPNLDTGGPDGVDFLIQSDSCSGLTIPAGGTCQFSVVFRPLTTGAKVAQVNVTTGGPVPHNIAVVTLNGTAISPAVSVNPAQLVFGNQQLGTQSAAKQVTITNSGQNAITIINVVPGGAAGADFLVGPQNCIGATLAAGASCTFSVAFTPITTIGNRIGFIQITSNAPAGGSDSFLPVSGVAISPKVGLSPATLNFGNVQLLSTSGSQTVTLTNSSGGPLTVTSLSFTGGTSAATGEFQILANTCGGVNGNPGVIPAGGTCTVDVTFTPTLAGNRNTFLTFTDDALGSPRLVQVYGVGLTTNSSVNPLQLNFGNQQVGTTSGVQTVTFTNTGNGPITLTTLSVQGQDLVDFSIQTDGCSGMTVAAGASCQFSVVFRPLSSGAKKAEVRNAQVNPIVVTLTGTGVTAALGLLSPGSLNFGNQQVGVPSQPQTVTLTNSTGGPIDITAITIEDPANKGDFSVTVNICGVGGAVRTLAAGASCTVNVVFQPTDQGSRTAILRFTDTAAGSPHNVQLAGIGFYPVPVLSPSALDFGNQVINTTSASQIVTLTNNGPGFLQINSVTLTGANPGDFIIYWNNGCGGILQPGQSCEVHVRFKPTALGGRTAFLNFDTNAKNNPLQVPLKGNGVPTPSYTVTVNVVGNCTATASPVGPYQAQDVVTLTATWNTVTTVFVGWTIDGTFVGLANPLNFTVNGSSHNVMATCVPRAGFYDVNAGTPYNEAIVQMASRGFIKGYGDGNYGPNDGILRAQMAGITVRLAGWSGIIKQNIFTDRCIAAGCVDDELWNAVAVVASPPGGGQVARGYEDNTYRPFDPVLNIQAVAFITRTMVALGLWQFQPDNPNIYPNIVQGTGHRIDIATYYFYAGAVPGTNPANPWTQWDQPSTRAYFAGIYWQGYQSWWSVDRVP